MQYRGYNHDQSNSELGTQTMLTKGSGESLDLSFSARVNGGTVRFSESPNDPWRNGYRMLSHSEFKAMEPSLVGQPSAHTSNDCPGCEMDASMTVVRGSQNPD